MENKQRSLRCLGGLFGGVLISTALAPSLLAEAKEKDRSRQSGKNRICLCKLDGKVEGQLRQVRGDVLVSGPTGFLDGKTIKRVKVGTEIITGSFASGTVTFGGKCRIRLKANEIIRIANVSRSRVCVRRNGSDVTRVRRHHAAHLKRFAPLFFISLPGALHHLHHQHHNNPVSR